MPTVWSFEVEILVLSICNTPPLRIEITLELSHPNLIQKSPGSEFTLIVVHLTYHSSIPLLKPICDFLRGCLTNFEHVSN